MVFPAPEFLHVFCSKVSVLRSGGHPPAAKLSGLLCVCAPASLGLPAFRLLSHPAQLSSLLPAAPREAGAFRPSCLLPASSRDQRGPWRRPRCPPPTMFSFHPLLLLDSMAPAPLPWQQCASAVQSWRQTPGSERPGLGSNKEGGGEPPGWEIDFIFVASTCPERLDEARSRSHTTGSSALAGSPPWLDPPAQRLARPWPARRPRRQRAPAPASAVRAWGGPGPRRAAS